MEKSTRDRLVQEVRERLDDIKKISSPDKLGGGWTNFHLQALIEEIDYLQEKINAK